jgi:hypothetical protein
VAILSEGVVNHYAGYSAMNNTIPAHMARIERDGGEERIPGSFLPSPSAYMKHAQCLKPWSGLWYLVKMITVTVIWSEALIIYGIYGYIALLMNFGKIMVILRVSSNFYKVEMSKNKAFFSYIKSIILRF